MKTNVLLLNIVTLLNLLGCQNTQQSTATPAKNPTTLQTTDGPSDGGGGDTCNGKMIESFKVDILQLSEVKTYLNNMNGSSTSIDGKNSFLKVMSTYKNWYMIDCALEQIPQARKGLYLKTEQAAVHTGKEVFIDSHLYNKMQPEEKAKLILHEVIMGMYLMKYMTIQEVCLMSPDCDIQAIEKFKHWKSLEPEIYKPLDETDHQRIRNVTIWAWSNKDNKSSFEKFRDILAANNFDSRFTSPQSSVSSDQITVTIYDVERMFKRHEWTQSYPEHCQFDKKNMVSQSKCKLSVKTGISQTTSFVKYQVLSVELKFIRQSDQKVFENKFEVYFDENGSKNFSTHQDKAMPFNYFYFAATSNYPIMINDDSLKEGHKTQIMTFAVSVDKNQLLQLLRLEYNTQVWYSVETTIVTQPDGQKKKITTGYRSTLDEESEIIFFENTLPYLSTHGDDQPLVLKESYIP